MTILSNKTIIKLSEKSDNALIMPFNRNSCVSADMGSKGMGYFPSKGLSHCGYDVSLQPKFRLSKRSNLNVNSDYVLDTIHDKDETYNDWFDDIKSSYVVIPPHGFVLGVTREYFNIPNNVVGSLFCKSTLARLGISLPPTIAEPGWSGELVVEIINNNDFPVRIHSGIGIGQMVFFYLDKKVKGYKGKYQNQKGVTLAK